MKTQSLPKAKQTKGLRALIRVTANNSFHKLIIFFTNLRPQYFDQTLSFNVLSKISFLTKIQLQNCLIVDNPEVGNSEYIHYSELPTLLLLLVYLMILKATATTTNCCTSMWGKVVEDARLSLLHQHFVH